MECGIPKIKRNALKACIGLFLLMLSACAGVGSSGEGLPGVSLSNSNPAQPLGGQRPSPGIDPTCKDKTNCLQNGILYFDEEKRVFTRLVDGKLKTEISGHLFENRAEGPSPTSSGRILLIKETVSQLCALVKVGEGGAVQFPFSTPAQTMPSFRYYLGREGYDHVEGPIECSTAEIDFDLFHHLLDFIVWDECFAPIPAEGTALNLSTPLDTPWTADYCQPAMRNVAGSPPSPYSVIVGVPSSSSAAFQRWRNTTNSSNPGDSDSGTDQDSDGDSQSDDKKEGS